MTLRFLVKQVLLFPLRPPIVALILRLLRFAGLLPRRVPGVWPPERILVVNPTHTVGDALMMLPLLDRLHRLLPDARMDLIAEPPMAGPLRHVSYLRHVFTFSPKICKNPFVRSYVHFVAMLRFARRELMGREYDLALLPRWGTDPYLLTYLASMSSAPQLAGHDPGEEGLPGFAFPGMDGLLTIVSRGGAGMAEAVRQMLLLTACGFVDEIDPAAEELRAVDSVVTLARGVDLHACMRRIGMPPDSPFILLAPGASEAARRWPAERFAALGVALRRETGADVWSVGSAGDSALGDRIEAQSERIVRSLMGKTSLSESIALTQRATLLVTNDSGPAHIGGSLGIRTLVLSACPQTCVREHVNSPSRVRPVGPSVVVLQPPRAAAGCDDQCRAPHAHCILGITTETARRAAMSLYLRRAPTASSSASVS